MSRIKSAARNLNLILSREISELLGVIEGRLNERADAYEKAIDERFEERIGAIERNIEERQTVLENRVDERATATERRVDEQIDGIDRRSDERISAIEQKSEEQITAIEQRVEERTTAIEERIDARTTELAESTGRNFDLRLSAAEKNFDSRLEVFENSVSERSSAYEAALDARIEERLQTVETRADERISNLEKSSGESIGALETRLESQFTERARQVDGRVDDRLSKVERHLDERFTGIERRTDERIESHEKRTDQSLERNRVDILDRTDIMLQILEQRLDRHRREVAQLHEQISHLRGGKTGRKSSNRQASESEDEPVEPEQVFRQQPDEQIRSFRKLAASTGSFASTRIQNGDSTLYQRILDWKNVSTDGLQSYTTDEQEVVDYILGFIADEDEKDYVRQHMRRFLATLQRIPPPLRSTDRLLELGSLTHLIPAIRKFAGYNEICGADMWTGDEKVVTETLSSGAEKHSFELRNFNVERDAFPYPDGHFRVVLCCELIEHLQSDPMHMLWECNRVLDDDGFLLLTTPNITSCRSIEGVLIGCTPYLLSQYNRETPIDQHNREYAPFEVGIALAAAGFTVLQLETDDVWMRSNPAILSLLEEVNLPTDMRGDNIFALARKTSAPIERHPRELYID